MEGDNMWKEIPKNDDLKVLAKKQVEKLWFVLRKSKNMKESLGRKVASRL